ncbi:MAG: PEP/pyruvate-binding domain-containing protein [Thermodesulfobacteriota bacterium]
MFKFLRRFLKEGEEDAQVRLQKRFSFFRELLESNNQALALMADMEEKLTGDFLFDTGYLHIQVGELEKHLARIVGAVNRLTDNRYPELVQIHQKIQDEIHQELLAVREIPDTPYVLPLSALGREDAPAVGGKMANLGEVKNRLGLPVPEGFAVTAAAYKRFLEASGLARDLEAKLAKAKIDDLESLEVISREVQELVRQAPLPADLTAALLEAGQSFAGRRLAVRSSAVGEDTDFSFAGQFETLLNVDPGDLPDHYRRVVASKFRPRAVFYWKYQQFSINELPMAVGCLAMVPARASGVMFSTDPQAPEAENVMITAVWGLGKYAVDGTITPDLYRVDRGGTHRLREQRVARKAVALSCQDEGGVREEALPEDQAQSPCLNQDQLKTLAEIALRLEKHFGGPQDIEWALDQGGRVVVLQSRPLRVSTATFGEPAREVAREPVPPLLRFGVRAAGGTAAGSVYLMHSEEEISNIPEGAVVVARQPSARLVLVMDRINAILTEVGSPTDHMSILAREFRVPTLVEVGGATRVLRPGQIVTVDADAARVYPGVVLEILERRQEPDEDWHNNPVFQKLGLILKKTAPLNLLDPNSPDFQAKSCLTLHDITRFCHEKAMDAMFFQDVEQALEATGVCRLKTELPLNIFILDLGGGLAATGQTQVTEDDITSLPFQALLRGFHHPQVRWAGQVAPDLKGFISVLANTMYDLGKAERGLGGKSFAIITRHYVNFNSRLGYHFGLVDAYLSEEKNDNYISFQFKGGAATLERRERRARLLKQLLDDLGFKVQVKGDLVQGRLVKFSYLETEETLELTGLLMAFCRQLDLALVSDTVLDRCLNAFRQEDYSLSCLRPEQAAS